MQHVLKSQYKYSRKKNREKKIRQKDRKKERKLLTMASSKITN